jgi:hypothetical protein
MRSFGSFEVGIWIFMEVHGLTSLNFRVYIFGGTTELSLERALQGQGLL